ncbi:MAG: Gfo/Idh/MocA family oxidoreductase [Opitutae bacterium]|nr:Gfo/Idh/MocA family oxidoreductase [Opitutae bacterium]
MNPPPHPRAGHPVSRREFLELCTLGGAAMLARRGRAADGPPERKLGVALVGLGGYSTGQLGPALRETRFCRLAGVVTGSPEKGRSWARDHGFPEKNVYGYGNMARLADNPDIDIVYVVTPNALHAEYAIAAARAGKHVICEKPMACTVAECDAILAACARAKVRLSIGYRLHFDPYHGELRRLVRTREFGAFSRMNGGFAFRMRTAQWRATKALAGGGPLMDLGVYVIQECCMATAAAPVAVTARERPKQRPEFFRDVEEGIDWTLEFADGARGEGYTSYNDGRNDFRAEAAGGWFELRPAYGYRNLRGVTSRGALNFEPPVNQQARQLDDFAQCILTGRASPVRRSTISGRLPEKSTNAFSPARCTCRMVGASLRAKRR